MNRPGFARDCYEQQKEVRRMELKQVWFKADGVTIADQKGEVGAIPRLIIQ